MGMLVQMTMTICMPKPVGANEQWERFLTIAESDVELEEGLCYLPAATYEGPDYPYYLPHLNPDKETTYCKQTQ